MLSSVLGLSSASIFYHNMFGITLGPLG
jgi:hypothetical protein